MVAAVDDDHVWCSTTLLHFCTTCTLLPPCLAVLYLGALPYPTNHACPTFSSGSRATASAE